LWTASWVLLVVALLKVLLEILPPLGEPMEEAERLLSCLVKGHLVLVLAALLGKGTGAVVNPLVAVDLGSSLLSRRSGDNTINTILGPWLACLTKNHLV
jgi:glycerol uptake facilitator-like aquaporin